MTRRYATIVLPSMIWPEIEAERMPLLRQTIDSLWAATRYPFELVVVDNGETEEHTAYLLSELRRKRIMHLVLNAWNMTCDGATDMGIRLSDAAYVVYSANDLRYRECWLTDCVRALEAHPAEKLIAVSEKGWHRDPKYKIGEIDVDGETWDIQTRGDTFNWVLRREDYYAIGAMSWAHHQAAFMATRAYDLGYRFACAPVSKVEHLGERNLLRKRGEEFRAWRPVKSTLIREAMATWKP